MRHRSAAILLATSCSGPDDASRYRAALAAPPAEAVRLCAELNDPDLGQECTTQAAVRFARSGQHIYSK